VSPEIARHYIGSIGIEHPQSSTRGIFPEHVRRTLEVSSKKICVPGLEQLATLNALH
jgi:hypothetical protein